MFNRALHFLQEAYQDDERIIFYAATGLLFAKSFYANQPAEQVSSAKLILDVCVNLFLSMSTASLINVAVKGVMRIRGEA